MKTETSPLIVCSECDYEFNVAEMRMSERILNMNEIDFKCPFCKEFSITMVQKERTTK